MAIDQVPLDTTSKSGEYNKRFEEMKTYADNYTSSWQDLARYIMPARGRFNEAKSTLGKMQDHTLVLDGHATQSVIKSASGMNSGITSKSRPWFMLKINDEILEKIAGVREWLDEVQRRMYRIFESSNIYSTFQNVYEEILTFCTACFILLEDFDTVIRTRMFTIGEYYLGIDRKGKVNAFARSFAMTVRQMVDEFGFDSCSDQVQTYWNSNKMDTEIRIRHLIEPNDTRNLMMKDFKNMPFRSIYWEQGQQGTKYLDLRGYKKFRVIAPRWMVPTTDVVYGNGPGWNALGDVKELQKTKSDKLIAQEKLHNPPVQSDASVEGHTNLLPGGVTKTTGSVPNSGVRAAYQVPPSLESFIEAINTIKKSIDAYFFTDLFSMFANLDRKNITAEEVMRREQERIMLMGPILNTLDEEMLSPVIELTYEIMQENGLLPPAPPEIQGADIKVQYISIMAQAQRSLGVTNIERLIGIVGAVMGMEPGVVDVFKWDGAMRDTAEMIGILAKHTNDDDEIARIRQDKITQQNMTIAMQAAASGADTAKTLSETEMDKDSALDRVMQGVPS